MKAADIMIIMMGVSIGILVCDATQESRAKDDARQEACSYRCLLAHGRWPTQVEWLGREEGTKRIKCECLYSEKVTP